MTLTPQEVNHIAHLASLDLSEEEKKAYREQLSAILDYAARLQSLDTSSIQPTSSVLPPRSVLRADVVSPSLPTDKLLMNASQIEDRQFKVPPVLD